MMPAYATRLLVPRESISYVTRPRAVGLGMLLALGAILLALAVFSAIVDPGFLRLASLPAFPLLGAELGNLIHRPVIFVTDRRVVSARRGQTPLSIDLDRLKAMGLQQRAVSAFSATAGCTCWCSLAETWGKKSSCATSCRGSRTFVRSLQPSPLLPDSRMVR